MIGIGWIRRLVFSKRHQHADLFVRVVESERGRRVLASSAQDQRVPEEAILAQNSRVHVQHAQSQDHHHSWLCVQEEHRRHSVRIHIRILYPNKKKKNEEEISKLFLNN